MDFRYFLKPSRVKYTSSRSDLISIVKVNLSAMIFNEFNEEIYANFSTIVKAIKIPSVFQTLK